MRPRAAHVVLLGSQETQPTVGRWLDALGVRGDIATITAGWQEWEGDDARLGARLGERARDLRLYQRALRVWGRDRELADAHRQMQFRIRFLRRAYNVRLARVMDAWVQIRSLTGDEGVLSAEREHALGQLQELDRHNARRVAEIRAEYEERYTPGHRDAVRRECVDIARILDEVAAVFLDGGHVPVLLNRLRLFGMADSLARKPIFAASGGAMVLSRDLVLFHDSPPQGPGHAELSEAGLGLFPGVVVLPHGTRRLRLDDVDRVQRIARRFAPSICVLLDEESHVEWDGRWWLPNGARRLMPDGSVQRWEERE
ncbi:MAG: hypothetical protein R3E98_10235 [Gemmatimonadota bacterium]|nr:hypothetical protein [Gemmatimonadota bacterium]